MSILQLSCIFTPTKRSLCARGCWTVHWGSFKGEFPSSRCPGAVFYDAELRFSWMLTLYLYRLLIMRSSDCVELNVSNFAIILFNFFKHDGWSELPLTLCIVCVWFPPIEYRWWGQSLTCLMGRYQLVAFDWARAPQASTGLQSRKPQSVRSTTGTIPQFLKFGTRKMIDVIRSSPNTYFSCFALACFSIMLVGAYVVYTVICLLVCQSMHHGEVSHSVLWA